MNIYVKSCSDALRSHLSRDTQYFLASSTSDSLRICMLRRRAGPCRQHSKNGRRGSLMVRQDDRNDYTFACFREGHDKKLYTEADDVIEMQYHTRFCNKLPNGISEH